MAEGKKSFILYSDLIHTVRKMPKDKAGELFLTILSYVNDENPVVEDMLIDVVFEPIKRQMKRDLQSWEQKTNNYSASGRLGGIKSGESRRKQNEAKRSNASKNEANEAVTVTVTDNVTVTENKNYLRLREKIIYQKVSDFFKENFQMYLEQWQMKNPGCATEEVLKKMDEEYICYKFNNENHLTNSFKSCFEKINKEKLNHANNQKRGTEIVTGEKQYGSL